MLLPLSSCNASGDIHYHLNSIYAEFSMKRESNRYTLSGLNFSPTTLLTLLDQIINYYKSIQVSDNCE